MDTGPFKQKLLDKQRDLEARLASLEADGRNAEEREVGDEMDDATQSEGISQAFEESALLSQTLEQVEDALRRIEDGTYGKCVVCGRPIEKARLEAIPWTPYCIEDQEKLERKLPPVGSTL
jgi:DnaK suppressor protein